MKNLRFSHLSGIDQMTDEQTCWANHNVAVFAAGKKSGGKRKTRQRAAKQKQPVSQGPLFYDKVYHVSNTRT